MKKTILALSFLVASAILGAHAQVMGGKSSMGGKASFGGGVAVTPTPLRVAGCAQEGPSGSAACAPASVTTGNKIFIMISSASSSDTYTLADTGSCTSGITTLDSRVTATAGSAAAQSFQATATSTSGSCTFTGTSSGGAATTILVLQCSACSIDTGATAGGHTLISQYLGGSTGANVVLGSNLTSTQADLVFGGVVDGTANGLSLTAGTSPIAWTLGSTNFTFPMGEEYTTQSVLGAIQVTAGYTDGFANMFIFTVLAK